jgi:hypothetical protein
MSQEENYVQARLGGGGNGIILLQLSGDIEMDKVSRKEYEKFLRRCLKIEKELHQVFPDIDRHDLHLIVRSLLIPRKWGRKFLLRKRGQRYVP